MREEEREKGREETKCNGVVANERKDSFAPGYPRTFYRAEHNREIIKAPMGRRENSLANA